MNKNIPVLKQSACAIFLSSLSLFTTPAVLRAQTERPYVRGWNTYLPYANVVDFDSEDNDQFYCISKASFFTYKHSEGLLERYSKANGMSDVEMAIVAADD